MTKPLLLRTLAPTLLLGIAAPFALPATTAQAAQSPAAEVQSVNRAIRAITTLKAKFVQTNAKGQVETGTMLLKQPGHIRFDFGQSNLLIVSDGRSLHMVDYDVAQVERYPIRSSPLGALLDPSRDLSRYGKLVESGDSRVVSVAVHDSAHPEAGTLTLVFTRKATAPGGMELYGWVMNDAQGNRTSIRLTDIVYGAPLSDRDFTWRDPRGSRVGPRKN